MKLVKIGVMGLAFTAVFALRVEVTAADLAQQLKDLNDQEKVEAGKIESQINAVTAKYDPAIKALEKQMNEQKDKFKGESEPLQNQLKALHDGYSSRKKPIQDAMDLKQKLKDLADKEAQEKKALADKKIADLKDKKTPAKDINKKFNEDMKAMAAKYKTENQKLEESLKKAMAEAMKKE